MKNKIIARYGKFSCFKKLKYAKTFREVADIYFEIASALIIKDGFHRPLAFFLKGHDVFNIVQTDHPDRASKYVLMRDLARLARIVGADGVLMIAEAWTAKAEDVPKTGFAADAAKRGEVLVIHALNAQGESFSLQAEIQRKKIKTWKVKRLGKTHYSEAFQGILLPFMKEWNCIDMKKLTEFIELENSFGIETPFTGDENQISGYDAER